MPQGDLKDCLVIADEFYDIAAKRVDEDILRAYATYRVYPVIVNYAFSCELFIKAMVMFRNGNGTFAKGHKLKKLMERDLPTGDYEEIRNRCGEVFRTPIDYALEEFNTAFEDWRYGFSNDGLLMEIDDLQKFAKVLKAYAHEIIGC